MDQHDDLLEPPDAPMPDVPELPQIPMADPIEAAQFRWQNLPVAAPADALEPALEAPDDIVDAVELLPVQAQLDGAVELPVVRVRDVLENAQV